MFILEEYRHGIWICISNPMATPDEANLALRTMRQSRPGRRYRLRVI